MTALKLSIDVMGGDIGPAVTIPAARAFLARDPDRVVILVGDAVTIGAALRHWPKKLTPRVQIEPTDSVVAMDESPSAAFRNKRDSSMWRALELVASGRADACVSAGNTGALMAMSRSILKTAPGVERPAIISPIPAEHGQTLMLDLGANIDTPPRRLAEFAVMGAALSETVYGVSNPRIGLLNVGTEANKGYPELRDAAALIDATALNYIGFVEGNQIFNGDADVVVCDGFIGNIALKSGEGFASLVRHLAQDAFTGTFGAKIASLFAKPALQRFRQHLDPRQHNGAMLIGLTAVVLKSHGAADIRAWLYALETAARAVNEDIPNQVAEYVGRHMPQSDDA